LTFNISINWKEC